MKRSRICMSSGFFEVDSDPETRAGIIDEFARALSRFPRWAVAAAWDDYMATETRRPVPAAIVKRAQAQIDRLAAELAQRDRREAEKREEREAAERAAQRPSPERAAEIASLVIGATKRPGSENAA